MTVKNSYMFHVCSINKIEQMANSMCCVCFLRLPYNSPVENPQNVLVVPVIVKEEELKYML